MRILVAGCGDVGTRVARAVAADGGVAWGLRRRPELLPASIRGLRADLASGAGLEALPEVDVVLYAAAADAFDDQAYRRAYVDGPRRLLAALRDRPGAVPPRRWVHLSSTSVYGRTDGAWVDEDSDPAPASFAGRRVLAGEALLADLAGATVLRLGGLYGPGRTRLLESVRSGRARCAEPPVFTNRIHVEDAAAAALHLARLETPARLYLGVDREPALDGEVKRWLARRLGVPEPPAAPTAGGRRRGGHKRCSSRRLVASGFRFRHPDFRSGYGALLDEPRAEPPDDGGAAAP